MADNRYGDNRGSSWSDRDRNEQGSGDADRAAPGWGARDDRWRSRPDDDDRGGGFFERAGEQVRSWFGGDDEDERSEQSWRGPPRGQDWRGGRSEWSEERQGGFGRGQSGRSSGQDRESGFGGGDRSWGYNDIGGMMGGFGNQRFGSSQDDHYRSWRDRQIEQLDRDYQEYCRENEQQFHQNFGTWRQNRQSQSGRQPGGETESGRDSSGAPSTPAANPSTRSASDSSFIGGGSDPSAATAGGGGDPTPKPTAPAGTRRSRG